MKNLLMATTGILAIGTSLASAADLPVRMPVKALPPVAAVYSWTGFYLGANLGGKWGRFGETFTAGAGTLGLGTGSNSSVVGGGQVGYQWQVNQIVFGVEADGDGTGLRRTFTSGAALAPFPAAVTGTIRNDWQASVRGRLGVAFDRVLVYGTGGGAWGNLRADGAFPGIGAIPAVSTSASDNLFGWTAGGGIDFGLSQGWSLGAEYRYTRFQGTTFTAALPIGAAATTPLTSRATLQTSEITARLNYHFNMGGPVMAAY